MTDQATIYQWNRAQEVAKAYKLTIGLTSTAFILQGARGVSLGHFEKVEHLYHFLLGYQAMGGCE